MIKINKHLSNKGRPRDDRGEARLAGPVVTLALAVAELITIGFGLGPPLPPALSFLFGLSCPGLVLLDLVPLPDLASKLMIAAGASIAFNVTVVTTLLVADVWSAGLNIAIAGSLCGLVAAVQAQRAISIRSRVEGTRAATPRASEPVL